LTLQVFATSIQLLSVAFSCFIDSFDTDVTGWILAIADSKQAAKSSLHI
jgi:hypothetical protein